LSELNLSFLGPPLISRSQTGEITFPKRKALALFAYLAVESDHPHSRESLMGLLWPELPTSAAQNNLRVTWSQVRKHLGEDQDDSDPYLVSTRLELGFNPKSDHTLDVRLFLDLIAATRAHGHSNLIECSECAERLTQAIELARGKFLGDFSLGDCPAFDEWLSVQRERLHLQITTTLEELVDFHEHAGQIEDAEQYVKRLLEIDPLREGTHRQLMRLLADSGQRSAALEQYETCRRLLANELGVAPAPETILLAEQIRTLAPTRKDKPRHNLPAPLSRFIGRRAESDKLKEALTKENAGIVTLAGPGGVGKTRLAVQVAHDLVDQFSDGVWLVELAGVQDASAVPAAVASVLNVIPDPRRSLTRTLGDHLREKSVLLVLDNCEHLIESCAQLVNALRNSAPGLAVFSTSRIPLHLKGERVIRLGPLPCPDLETEETLTAVQALEYDSIQLFNNRAMQALLSFSITDSNAASISLICRDLDGIPLAVELAAARTGTMSVEAIAERLDQRFRWLNAHTTGTLPRQKTLYNLIEWSYELLSDHEKDLFRRLSVFSGGWTLEMAEAVGEDANLCAELLGQLVDESLVTFGYDPEKKRYRMHESIRQFAAAKLTETSADEKKIALEKHHIYFTNLLASQKEVLQGESPSIAINLIRTDQENIRLAWQ
jgi:predicted ATPase/DNA-binding SARP family transcriptional activator